MKYVNRIRFDAIRTQWEILRMSAAYIHAEQRIVNEAAKGNDITGAGTEQVKFDFDPTTPEQFHTFEVDGFGNIRQYSEEEELIKQGLEVQAKLNKALEDEDYRKAAMFTNVLDGLRIKYNKLKE